jgi:hypothetical protein
MSCNIVFETHMNILFIIKVEMPMLIKWYTQPPHHHQKKDIIKKNKQTNNSYVNY